ncbi:site-specific DNA-methyltransferase [Saccharothrix sp. 6-C]|uniref:site-specific DNA-methyltransferase n=1 Tax=Saccharothrix sp. 6-C TaxID=2781735 RepID=UPI00191728B0|nr:site-specific DNA-methyltransferase [Saccharothrix sp. 6-C]QQQ75488.1 site-specific DNA-methyltransferase [Saccharothrix sp. 6-C]
MSGVRLEWDGKEEKVARYRLPLQVVETVNASRADRGTLFADGSEESDGWRNRLIWGDNLHVLSALVEEFAGQIDLIYIDPPFDSRQDYKVRIAVGDEVAEQDLTKISSVIEEKAYRDTWGKGVESYLDMLYKRLVLLRELLSDRGSLFLHLAPNVSHLARVLLDEIFGQENFRAEIIWKRTAAHASTKDFGEIHDSILCFAKSSKHIWHPQYRPYDDSYVKSHYSTVDEQGRQYQSVSLTGPGKRSGSTGKTWRGFDPNTIGRHWAVPIEELDHLDTEGRILWSSKGGFPRHKRFITDAPGQPIGDVWDDIYAVNAQAKERLGYDTQKPEALLERIIKSSSDEGSIVLDCFTGSGTTPAVAERLNRRWIAVDIGRFAIHTTRKRLLGRPGCKPFEVCNLGRYERQVWQRDTTGAGLQAYLDFIIDLYGATAVHEFQHIHGTLGKRAVHVGAVDAPVSLGEVKESLEEAQSGGYPAIDVLGWEFEMGLHEIVQDEARARGLDLRLRQIPREVMDPRVVASGEFVFHELAYIKVESKVKKREVSVRLVDFVIPNPGLLPASIRDKITGWSDYVDYWAVDFTFGESGSNDTFHNQWQSYRTQANRSLELTAVSDYDEPGTYTVLVKVVDIFGNDTTTSVAVTIK